LENEELIGQISARLYYQAYRAFVRQRVRPFYPEDVENLILSCVANKKDQCSNNAGADANADSKN
jgi:hypothetical protein